jgi:energy-coupling factor transporter ATP-binding protein EcfA2
MSATLVIRDLRVAYHAGNTLALRGTSLTLKPGERCALLGLNGSGKTTLLRAVAGLLPFSGAIEVCGIALRRETARAVRDRLGFLFGTPDDQLLFPQVLADVAFALERTGRAQSETHAAARQTLEALGIGACAERAPHALSQGQRQRVALAGALIAQPPLLLLDEPTASLDPVGREELAQVLVRQPATLLIATHDVAFARQVVQRFIMLEAGVITDDTDDPARIETAFARLRAAVTSGRRARSPD